MQPASYSSLSCSSSGDTGVGESSLEEVKHLGNTAGVVQVSRQDRQKATADSITSVADDVGLGGVEVGDLLIVLRGLLMLSSIE